MSSAGSQHYPVVVIGAGLTGMSASLELDRLGVAHRVFEKLPAAGGGKTKTVTQLIALGFLLSVPMIARDWAHLVPSIDLSRFVEYVSKTGLVIFTIGTFLAVWSGWRYVAQHKALVFTDANS